MTSPLDRTDREILALAIPALGALAIDPLLTLADTAFVARLGTTPLAALGVDTAILNIAFFAFNFLAYVVTPLVARALSRGERELARRWVGDALVLAFGLGVVLTAILATLAPVLVGAMGATGEVADQAVGYLRIRALATVAVLVVTTSHGAFRGHKDTRTPLKVAAVVNGINVILDPILIFGAGMGLNGAAVATVIAQYLGAVWFLAMLRARGMAARPRGLRVSLPSLLALGRSGALLTLRTGLLLVAFTAAASTATRIGPATIAAHQIVAQVFLLAAMLADSFAIAAQAMVAERAGRGEIASLHAVSLRLTAWGLGAGVAIALGMGLGRHGLVYLAGDGAVASLAISAAGVVALVFPLAAVLFVADGIYLGLLSLRTMAASSGIGAAAAVALLSWSVLGETLNGIWWALAVFLVIRGLVLAAGYRRSALTAVRS